MPIAGAVQIATAILYLQKEFWKILGSGFSIIMDLKFTHSKPTWMCSWWVRAEPRERFCSNWFSFFINRVLIFQKLIINRYRLVPSNIFEKIKKCFPDHVWGKKDHQNARIFPNFHSNQSRYNSFLTPNYRRPPS